MTAKRITLVVIGIIVFVWLISVAMILTTTTHGAMTDRVTTVDGLTFGQDPEPPNQVVAGSSYEKAGCDNSKAQGYITGLGFRIVTTKMWQSFCWAHGHITYVGDLKKQVDFTAFGQATNIKFDGWRDGPNGWWDYQGKTHGGHFVNKAAKFKGCIPLLLGCVDVHNWVMKHEIVQYAGGHWDSDADGGRAGGGGAW